MPRRIIGLLAASVLGSALTATPAPAAPRAATPPAARSVVASTSLDMATLGDLVVDGPHGRLFLTDGAGRLQVRGLDGSRLAAFADLDRPTGMTLAEDGSTLYVAVADGRLLVVDPVSLAMTSLAVPGTCPNDVAAAAGVLWVASTCGSAGSIVAVDPASGAVTPGIRSGLSNPWLLTSPALPGRLVWTDSLPAGVRVEAATGGSTPTLTQVAGVQAWNTGCATISPDGGRMVTSCDLDGAHTASTADLQPTGVLRAGFDPPSAVAFRGDGMLAIGSGDRVRLTGPAALVTDLALTGNEPRLVGNGLAFAGDRLFAVVREEGPASRPLSLEVLDSTVLDAPTIVVKRQRGGVWSYDDAVGVTLALPYAAVVREVRIWGTFADGERRLVHSEVVGPGTSYALQLRPRENVELTADFTQVGRVSASSAPRSVEVGAKIRQKALRPAGHLRKYATYRVGHRAYVRGNVLPRRPGSRQVRWTVQYMTRGGGWAGEQTRRLQLSRRSTSVIYFSGASYLRNVPLRVRLEWLGDRSNAESSGEWTYVLYR